MSKIDLLREDLAKQEEELNQQSLEKFNSIELTEEEEKRLQELKDTKQIVVTEESGINKVETSINDYLGNIDATVKTLKDTKIKLMSNLETDRKKLSNELNKELRSRVKNSELSEDDMDVAIEDMITSLKKYFNKDNITSNDITKLNKLPLSTIKDILPEAFIRTFSDYTNTRNEVKIKEELLVAVGYCIATGPELDRLNEDITNQENLIQLMMKLTDCNMEVMDMLTSEESVSEVSKRILMNNPDVDNKYRKYVKTPDKIHNLYVQKAYITEKMVEAYKEIRETLDKDYELEAIDKEINHNTALAEVYMNILNLSRYEITVDNIIKNKTTYSNLNSSAYSAYEKIRKIPEEVSLPGFVSGKSSREIYTNYLDYFDKLIPIYNKVIQTAHENGDTELSLIEVDGKTFGMYLMIVTTKVIEYLSKKKTLANSVEIVVMFDMMCRFGTELFMLDKMNRILSKLYK